jgi:UDP-galactopyranose mutase
MLVDYLVIGSGLTGATIARCLADEGREVLVTDRRGHMGGNVHDHCHASGIRIHTYGPHYFRTNSEAIWEFVTRFAAFDPYQPALKAWVDGRYENWPIAGSYIRRTVEANWKPSFCGIPENFEQASLAMMPTPIYDKFVRGYTEKQWGVPPFELSSALAKRFDIREDDEPRLMRHKYQGIPRNGYASFMQNLLAGIPVTLNYDYLLRRDELKAKKALIFTGPIDEFFQFRLGRLKYRGQRRTHEYIPEVDFVQPCGQVNNPQHTGGPHIRTLEWKHMMPAVYARQIRGTVLTREVSETPSDPDHYEYPFPDETNARLYRQYRTLADSIPDLMICGRLGEYRYYDMDQAIGRAMMLFRTMDGINIRAASVAPSGSLTAA